MSPNENLFFYFHSECMNLCNNKFEIRIPIEIMLMSPPLKCEQTSLLQQFFKHVKYVQDLRVLFLSPLLFFMIMLRKGIATIFA